MSGLPELSEVARLLGEVIGIPEPAPGDNFVEIGGDSLTALQVAILAEERWGAEIDVQDVVVADDVEEIHRLLVASVHQEPQERTPAGN